MHNKICPNQSKKTLAINIKRKILSERKTLRHHLIGSNVISFLGDIEYNGISCNQWYHRFHEIWYQCSVGKNIFSKEKKLLIIRWTASKKHSYFFTLPPVVTRYLFENQLLLFISTRLSLYFNQYGAVYPDSFSDPAFNILCQHWFKGESLAALMAYFEGCWEVCPRQKHYPSATPRL